MNNVFPFRDALSLFAAATAAAVLPDLHRFAVSIFIGGDEHSIEVLAFTSCDAVSNAIDEIFNGEREMPRGAMRVTVNPIDDMPRAA